MLHLPNSNTLALVRLASAINCWANWLIGGFWTMILGIYLIGGIFSFVGVGSRICGFFHLFALMIYNYLARITQ